MISMLKKVAVGVSVFLALSFPRDMDAQEFGVETRSDLKFSEMDALQQQETHGYEYDPYETEKKMIFHQMQVITGDEETRYIIVPGDTLTISFMDKEERVGSLYKVSGIGEVFLPFAGAVKVAGLNRKQAFELFTSKLGEYIRKPEVMLAVKISGRIMILGEVGRPGLYLMQPNLTVMEAILKAESYDKDNANLKSIVLMRGGTDKPEVMRLNLLKMIKSGDRTDDIFVKPGDLIFVPKTFIANLDKFKDDIYQWVNTYYAFGRLPASPAVLPNQPVLYK